MIPRGGACVDAAASRDYSRLASVQWATRSVSSLDLVVGLLLLSEMGTPSSRTQMQRSAALRLTTPSPCQRYLLMQR